MKRKYYIRIGIHIGRSSKAAPIHLRNLLCNKVEFKLIAKNLKCYLSRNYSDGFSIVTFHNIEDFPQLIDYINLAINELKMWDWICHIEIHEEPYEGEFDEFGEPIDEESDENIIQ